MLVAAVVCLLVWAGWGGAVFRRRERMIERHPTGRVV